MDFSPDKLRAHFADLTAKREKIDVKLNPLRAELDELVKGETKLSVKATRSREDKVRDQIKALQNELYPVEMERATVARALGGKTGGAE